MNKLEPIHPGEILSEEFLKPLKISQYKLAKSIDVPAIRISAIVHGKRSVSVDTALRLGKFLNTSAEFWVNLQSHYDLQMEEEIFDKTISKNIKTFEFAV